MHSCREKPTRDARDCPTAATPLEWVAVNALLKSMIRQTRREKSRNSRDVRVDRLHPEGEAQGIRHRPGGDLHPDVVAVAQAKERVDVRGHEPGSAPLPDRRPDPGDLAQDRLVFPEENRRPVREVDEVTAFRDGRSVHLPALAVPPVRVVVQDRLGDPLERLELPQQDVPRPGVGALVRGLELQQIDPLGQGERPDVVERPGDRGLPPPPGRPLQLLRETHREIGDPQAVVPEGGVHEVERLRQRGDEIPEVDRDVPKQHGSPR